MWTGLVKRDDWGNIYYAPEGKDLTPQGHADADLGIPFEKIESLRVRFPDGTEEMCPLRGVNRSNRVGDMGHSYSVSSMEWFACPSIHGLTVPIEVNTIEVWIET